MKKPVSAFNRLIDSGKLAKIPREKRNFANNLARKIARKYDLSYRSQVNIEASINGMLHFGMLYEDVRTILWDIFDNLAFVNTVPTIVPGKGLIQIPFSVPGEDTMRKEYDFSKLKVRKGKYAKRMKGK
jgi:hypothetical protein